TSASDLHAVIEDLREGRGSAVLVVAPPGRARRELLDELYADAGAAGILAARGRMVQLGVLAGVVDALDEIGQRRPALVERVPDGCRSELATVFAGGPPSTIGRLQLAARELVLAAAEDGGILLVLHDLEMADRATLVQVEQWAQLARRAPIGLVVAHRDPGVLAGLTIHEPDRLRPRPTDRYVPELPEEVTTVLTRIALVGPAIDPLTFRAVSGVTPEQADRVLELAVGAGLLERDGDTYRFASADAATALVDRLGPHRRAELHHEVAEALAAAGGPAPVVAEHYLAAGEASAAVPFVLEAARVASGVHAHSDVLALTESVLDHAEGDARVELLALRAMALVATGDTSAPRCLREALALAGPEWAPMLRLGLAQASILSSDVDGAADALEGLELDGGPNDGAILLLRGMVAFFRGDIDAAELAARDARDLALAPGAPGALLDVITLQGMIAHNRGEWFDRIRRELRATQDDPALATKVFDGQLCVTEYLLYGPLPYDEVVALARGLQATAEQSGARRAEAFALCLSGEALLLAGHLDEARVDLERSMAMHQDLHADAGTALCLQRLAEVELANGDRETAARHARQALSLARWSPLARHLIQRIYGTLIAIAPDADTAVALVTEAENAADPEVRCNYCDIMLAVPATAALAEAGRLDEARSSLERAQRAAGLWHGTAWQGAVAEAESVLARAEGRDDEAEALLARAAGLFDQAGQPLDAARCREAAVG
ncbi:MAG: tetratricopeptide repeat protein, partial [Acidimicrobiales bacterium]